VVNCGKNIFAQSVKHFLEEHGVPFVERDERCLHFPERGVWLILVPLDGFDIKTEFDTPESDTIYLYEDRWVYRNDLMKKRILARLGIFRSLFARKCRIIDDSQIKADSRKNLKIKDFLELYHSYGDARCKYRYALEYDGDIVAVATFSSPRPMPRCTDEGSVIVYDSYEWVRYASLPDCRVIGGMGRLLKAFISDITLKNGTERRPVEVMTYADLEWSAGEVYSRLGFKLVQKREPVEFLVNQDTFERIASNKFEAKRESSQDFVKIKNLGSLKYLYQM